jgi:pimeloyl-ACP methyl ester carboxylesterase
MVDFVEAGSSGPLVVLIHSSVSGARMWRRLMEDLQDRFRVRAPNLIGYGRTPAWTADRPQSLDDQARLVEAAIPSDADEVFLVGHSLGGAVAMKTAARLGGRVTRLVLIEPNLPYLLRETGREEAFAEACSLRDSIKEAAASGVWDEAAETFADFWGGAGAWDALSSEKRAAFALALRPSVFEWDAVMGETSPLDEWAAKLPRATLLISDPQTVLLIRELASVLLAASPHWSHAAVPGAGHMAPLTRPDVINPIVGAFLRA